MSGSKQNVEEILKALLKNTKISLKNENIQNNNFVWNDSKL